MPNTKQKNSQFLQQLNKLRDATEMENQYNNDEGSNV